VGGASTGDQAFRQFLLDSFSREELRMLASLLGGGLVENIAWEASLNDLVGEFTAALERYGLLNAELFDVLARFRPRRARQLQVLRRDYVLAQGQRHIALIHESRDGVPTRTLGTFLRSHGYRTWTDIDDIPPGGLVIEEIDRGLRQAFVLLVIVSAEHPGSGSSSTQLAFSLSLAHHAGVPIIPVLIGDAHPDSLPETLSRFRSLRLGDDLAPLLDAVRKVALRAIGGRDRDASPILNLSLQFLEAAGRDVQPIDPAMLRIPEPVVLATTSPPTTFDVAALEGVVTEAEVAYFLHDGPLPELVSQRFDGMRVRGNPVVTMTADTMRAALQDGNAPAVFAEHTRLGTTGVNLFEATNAIANPNLFFGRTELLNQVGGALGRGDAVLVTGVRKAGKSSFLHMLRQQFSTRPTAWIDLQRLSRSDPLWPDRVFARILEAWDRWGRDTWSGDWPFKHKTTKTRKPAFIEGMEARSEHQKKLGRSADVLVVLDELERMIPVDGSVEEAECFEDFAGALRSLAQAADRCVAVLAADLRPEANRRNLLPNLRTNPWFNFFVEVPLPPLTATEVRDMVKSLALRMGVTSVDEAFASSLYAITGGHAYLTRLVSAAAWSSRQSPRQLALHDLESGLHQLESEAVLRRFYEENLWAPLTAAEQRALIAMLPGPPLAMEPPRDSRDVNATASLRAQGLVGDGGILLLGFKAWLGSLPESELKLATDRNP
jgi:hypothetical protein